MPGRFTVALNGSLEVFTADDQLRLRDAFVRLIPVADAFTTSFYSRLFDGRPDIRAMFPKELSKQRERFMVMLATMLDCLRDPERFAADCRALGERHEGYGVQEEHYPLVQAALRDALLEHVPDRMSESDVELWQRLFEAIGAQMRLA